jgi:hypothetical protein
MRYARAAHDREAANIAAYNNTQIVGGGYGHVALLDIRTAAEMRNAGIKVLTALTTKTA